MVDGEKFPMPDDEMFDEIEMLYNKIDELHKLMLQKDKVSLRIVTTPEKILFQEKVFEVEKSKKDESYYLKISMPFVDKKELDLYQKGDGISISIKNEKRNF